MVAGVPFIDTTTGELKYIGTSGSGRVIVEADGSIHLIPGVASYTGMSGAATTAQTGFTAIGTITFNPAIIYDGDADITRTIKFQALVECTPGVTAEIRLFNISTAAAVTSSLLSSSATSPTLLEGTLALGASPNLPNSLQTYEIQFRISLPASPALTDRAVCKLAQLTVLWS